MWNLIMHPSLQADQHGAFKSAPARMDVFKGEKIIKVFASEKERHREATGSLGCFPPVTSLSILLQMRPLPWLAALPSVQGCLWGLWWWGLCKQMWLPSSDGNNNWTHQYCAIKLTWNCDVTAVRKTNITLGSKHKGYLFCSSWNWDKVSRNTCFLGVKNSLKDFYCLN